jgi:hypothetical protein
VAVKVKVAFRPPHGNTTKVVKRVRLRVTR